MLHKDGGLGIISEQRHDHLGWQKASVGGIIMMEKYVTW